MGRPLRAVVIGAAHVHILEVCKYVNDCEEMELAGVADVAPADAPDLECDGPYTRRWNLEFVRRYGANVYDDYQDMLERVRPDLALITTENCMHVEVAHACIERGVSVCVEKPMACDLAGALKIARLARERGVEVFVNWPIAWREWLYRMKDVLDSGRMGPLIKVRYLAGQTGPLGPGALHRGTDGKKAEEMAPAQKSRTWWYQKDHGGGAFLDMCCYGSMMSVWLTGSECQAVSAMCGNFAHDWSDVEDNGIMLLRFPKSVAVVEGTWTTPAAAIAPGPEIFCRGGVIACERRGAQVAVYLTDLYGNVEYLPDIAPDPALRNIACAFAAYRLHGREMPPITRLENNLRSMAILDAGLRSVRSGKTELVDNAVWGNMG